MKKVKATRALTVTAVLTAMAVILSFFPKFKLPFLPSFLSLDFADLPALIGSFALGPLSGVIICLIKNLIGLFSSMTGGVGELSNFIISASFVLTAGIVYKYKHSFSGAIIGATLGALLCTALSLLTNYYLVYPIYYNVMSQEAVMNLYKAINPNVNTLWDALLWFNAPFTFGRELLNVLITFLIYKRITPLLKGTKNRKDEA